MPFQLESRLEQNACASLFESPKQEARHKEDNVQQSVSHSDISISTCVRSSATETVVA